MHPFCRYVLLGALLFLSPSAPRAETPPGLDQRVAEYLMTEDESRAAGLLDQIVDLPGVTVDAAESAVRRAVPYGPEKTGSQVDLPIRVGGEEMRYALYVPETYDPKKPYPLILCLHGAGFSGDRYLERWQPRLREEFILACPTLSDRLWWSFEGEALIWAVHQEIVGRYHIDSNRVILTGMSNGGIGTYLVGMHRGDRLAAIAPMASGIPKEIFPFLANFRQAGVYILHGAKDQVMPVFLSRDIAAEFDRIGYPVVYREHEREHPMAGGHFFPREELPALVDWFSKQRRDPYPKEVYSVRDADHLGRFYWTEIDQVTEPLASVLGSITDREEAQRVRRGIFASLHARIRGNTIEVDTTRVRRLTLYVHPRMLDLDRPVAVWVNGEKRFEGLLRPDLSVLLHEARIRRDPAMLFGSKLTLDLPDSGESSGDGEEDPPSSPLEKGPQEEPSVHSQGR